MKKKETKIIIDYFLLRLFFSYFVHFIGFYTNYNLLENKNNLQSNNKTIKSLNK